MNAEIRRVTAELGLALDASDRAALERARSRSPGKTPAALVEEVLVHETWFFRDPQVFDGLALFMRGRKGPVRVLSAPCSTGEEAYSAAIALLDAGIPAEELTVLGVDVSGPALARAEAARYGASALRKTDGAAVRGLERDGAGWVVEQRIRRIVGFRRENLLEKGVLSDAPPFDVVLCRNLFVYLTDEARRRLEATLARLVAPGGLLLLGHADALSTELFQREGAPERFAHRRASGAVEPRPPAPEVERGDPGRDVEPVAAFSAPGFDDVRRLADAGDIEQAAALCERLIESNGPDAGGYALLGALESARGKAAEAMRHWQRALYLDPEQPEALIQLGRAFRDRGESARSEALLSRAARLRRDP